MVSYDKPWPVSEQSTGLTTSLEDVIRQAAILNGWGSDETVKRIDQLVGKHPNLKKELDKLLLEAFERAVSAELLAVVDKCEDTGKPGKRKKRQRRL